jgi:hypothetical protein
MKRAFDTVFALVHLALLIGALAYGVYALAAGHALRGALLLALLVLYYFLVLHAAVRKEIARRGEKRR